MTKSESGKDRAALVYQYFLQADNGIQASGHNGLGRSRRSGKTVSETPVCKRVSRPGTIGCAGEVSHEG